MTGPLTAGLTQPSARVATRRACGLRGGRAALALLAAGALLAACEGLPGYGEAPVQADNSNLDPPVVDLPEDVAVGEPPLPPRRPDVAGDLALAPPVSAPLDDSANEPVDVESLVGLDTGEAEALLGAPASQEVQPPAQVWSYNGPDCVLTIFFYPQVEGERFRALAYDVTRPAEAEPAAAPERAAEAEPASSAASAEAPAGGAEVDAAGVAPDRTAQRCFTALVAQNRTAARGREAPAGPGVPPGISGVPLAPHDDAAAEPGQRNVAESAPAN